MAAFQITHESSGRLLADLLGTSQPTSFVQKISDSGDASRHLSVVVPLEEGQGTIVNFRQNGVALNKEKTRFALFPPLSKSSSSVFSLSSITNDDSAFSVTKMQNRQSFTMMDARVRWEVYDPLHQTCLLNKGVIVEQQDDAVCLLETDEQSVIYGMRQFFAWPHPKLLFRTMDASTIVSMSNDPYLFITANRAQDLRNAYSLSYSLSSGIRASTVFTLSMSTSVQAVVITKNFLLSNTSDVNFDRIDEITVVNTTSDADDTMVYRPRALRFPGQESAMMMAASSSSSPVEVATSADEGEESIQEQMHYVHKEKVSLAPGSSTQLVAPHRETVPCYLVFHVGSLFREGANEVRPVLWFDKKAMNAAVTVDTAMILTLSELTEEPIVYKFTWSHRESTTEDDRSFLRKPLRTVSTSLITAFATQSTTSKGKVIVDIELRNYFNSSVVFALDQPQAASYSSDVAALQHMDWTSSAAPRSYVLYTVPAGKHINVKGTFIQELQ